MSFARAKSPLAGLALAGLLSVGAGPAALAASPSLAPHLATYRLSLSKLTADRSITHATGQIEFELSEGCDGWTVHQRTRMILVSAQGMEVTTGWRFRAWESKDGLSYRFFTKRLLFDGSVEEVRGKARLDGPGLGGVVDELEFDYDDFTLSGELESLEALPPPAECP